MNNKGWRAGRRRAAARYQESLERECPAGFKSVRVHDLRHTFGRRLRAAGVGLEDRQDLLGHKSSRMTDALRCVAFILNVTDPDAARNMLEKLPLGQAHLMTFELIRLAPLSPLRQVQGMTPTSP